MFYGGCLKVLTPHELCFLHMRNHPTFAAITVRDIDLACNFVFIVVSIALFLLMEERLLCSCKTGGSSPVNHFSTLPLADSLAWSLFVDKCLARRYHSWTWRTPSSRRLEEIESLWTGGDSVSSFTLEGKVQLYLYDLLFLPSQSSSTRSWSRPPDSTGLW